MGLKNRSAFREFNKESAQCDLYLKVFVLTLISKLKFSSLKLLYRTIKWKF